jgi:hypothetical protein
VGGSTDSGLPESTEPDFGVELKVSGSHDLCGLTLGRNELLWAGAIRAPAIDPVRGRIGELDAIALLAVLRRTDGIPVGEALGVVRPIWRAPCQGTTAVPSVADWA